MGRKISNHSRGDRPVWWRQVARKAVEGGEAKGAVRVVISYCRRGSGTGWVGDFDAAATDALDSIEHRTCH